MRPQLLSALTRFCVSGLTLWVLAQPGQGADQETLRAKETTLEMQTPFHNPPQQYRMLQIVHELYRGSSPEEWVENLSRFGYGGVVSNVSFTDYLESEEQWELFEKALQLFRSQGMEFWIYDEKGYPSGKAGGITLRDRPELETLGVLCARTEGQGTLRHAMPTGERIVGGPLYACAAPVNEGRYDLGAAVELTGQANAQKDVFEWTPPDARDWGILSFHVKRMYEGTHIVCNYSDTLPYINIMDREAVGHFIEVTHEAYKKRCSEAFDGYVHAVFTDEPSLMSSYLHKEQGLLPAVPWSRTFPELFEKTYGYSVVGALPYLFEDGGEDTLYRRLDFWKLVATMIEQNYYGQIQEWCRANNTRAAGHALLEETIYWHALYEGDLYRDLRRMDLPGIDMLTSNPTNLARSTQIPIPKFVSSVTHMIGEWECMSETSSHVERMNKIPCSFEQRLGTINYQYVLGLTRITSYYAYNEFDDTQRRLFNDHIGRLGYMLTRGAHVADLGVYYPIQSIWGAVTPTSRTSYEPAEGMRVEMQALAEGAPIDSRGPFGYLIRGASGDIKGLPRVRLVSDRFGQVSNELLANQRDFDYLDDEAILTAEIQDGALQVQGETFRCILLPEAWVMPAETLDKIEAFVQDGGCVVALGQLPEKGMTRDETRRVQAVSARLAESERVTVVHAVPEVPGAVDRFLPADLALDAPCRELFYVHRCDGARHIYFVTNLLDAPVKRHVTFRAQGTASLWHPSTGEVRPADAINGPDTTSVALSLDAFEGVLVVIE
jgi:hypothetical protein